MKKKILQLSIDMTSDQAIYKLDHMVSKHSKEAPSFQMHYNQAISFIEDFISKAKKISKSGTTLHIQKEIVFENEIIVLVLNSPIKIGFFEKIVSLITGK